MNAQETNVVFYDARQRLPSLDEGLLSRLVLASIADVEQHCGAPEDVSEVVESDGCARIITLRRPILSITGIVERRAAQSDATVVLDPTDYRVLPSHRLLRLQNGVNPAFTWGAEVSIVYDPVVDVATRQRVVLDLVVLSSKFRAEDRMSIGSGAVQLTSGDHEAKRAELLGLLSEGRIVCEVA